MTFTRPVLDFLNGRTWQSSESMKVRYGVQIELGPPKSDSRPRDGGVLITSG